MSQSTSAPKGRDKPAIVVGFLMLALAGILWADAVSLGSVVAYGIGPAVVPKIIAAGLVLLGLLSILSGFRSAGTEPEEADFGPVGILVIGFLVLTAMIGFGGGFVPAMAVLFAITSFAFGRRAVLVDLAIGVVLSTLIYLLFSKLLTLSLPQGPLERLLG
ncbi:MAG: tripartite tricarboxylate transporter TctB [Rhizobiales bacterium PAR1]|nr:MAG: tripartite tricarboxylate transporter TctB [Rhizobiales bacterium PAR1]